MPFGQKRNRSPHHFRTGKTTEHGWGSPFYESPAKSRKSAKIKICNMLILLKSQFAKIPDLDFLQGTLLCCRHDRHGKHCLAPSASGDCISQERPRQDIPFAQSVQHRSLLYLDAPPSCKNTHTVPPRAWHRLSSHNHGRMPPVNLKNRSLGSFFDVRFWQKRTLSKNT